MKMRFFERRTIVSEYKVLKTNYLVGKMGGVENNSIDLLFPLKKKYKIIVVRCKFM